MEARFSASVQTNTGAHPTFPYKGYRVSFPVVKRLGYDVDQPTPTSAEVKERVDLYLYSPLGLQDLF